MFDAYEVAIRLNLVDRFSPAVSKFMDFLVKGNMHAERLQKRLDIVGKMFAAGAATTGAGWGIAMALKASTTEAVRYEQQMNRLQALNLDSRLGKGTTQNLVDQANRIADSTKGTSKLDALRLITETQSITADPEHTQVLAPMLAKIRFGVETYMSKGGKGEGHGEVAEKQFTDLVKVMEMRGLMRNFSEAQMKSMGDLFVRSFVASGGQVNPSSFLAMMKTGGTSAKSVSDDFIYALGHIMQEKGGSRSGTAMMSSYQNLVAGRMPQQIAETLEKLGLLQHSALHYGKTGHITKVDPGGMVDSDLLIRNPLEYLQKHILPALQKAGVDTNDTQKTLMKLNSISGQRTTSDFWAQLYMERGQIGNYVEQAKGVTGYEALYAQSGKSMTGDQKDLIKKVNDLELEFGMASLPVVKSALEQAIPLVKQFGEWMEKNRGSLDAFVKGVAGLAVVSLISGQLMMAGSAIGLLSTGLSLLSGPLSAVSLAMAMRDIGGAKGIATLAGSLSTVGGQFGLLSAAVGGFGIGYAIGSLIAKLMEGTKAMDWFGDKIARVLAFMGNKEAQDAVNQHDGKNPDGSKHYDFPNTAGAGRGSAIPTFDPVGPPKTATANVTVTNRMDRRGFSSMVAGDVAKAQFGVMGSGTFDPGIAQPDISMRTN